MKSEPAPLGEISLDFSETSTRWDENFPRELAQKGQPTEQGGKSL